MTWLAVALGSALGGVFRYGATLVILPSSFFPWGTLFVNVFGSFIIGLGAAAVVSSGELLLSGSWRVFFMVGFCGGFTTFSSFSLQTLALLQDGRPVLAITYILASVLLCLGGTALGFLAARLLSQWGV
ncbi:fluoride efflux transporter CrcB [Phaeovibrio sulfidiphilus]|uniref:Fluoride-specific ion channel FluC n=1 Tax=Phaeovibrio sulfidiphilus TaxID=1220600 RepID=A0A8J7CWR1_9PROT|nr:fluoride efflux transporter CrcB [Phaeovibrio sulfidiphilus]MBE1237816.1 fluoride efflux transporter CrcB [Phaeovibrio sulfidiphilus]